MNLRPYQADCLAAIRAEFERSRVALVVMATGLGKTVVFATLARDWSAGRVLILAHREELIHQAADKVFRISGERPDVEKAELKAAPCMYGGSKVVVASVQSLCRPNRLGRSEYRPEEFGLVIVDEAHHATKGNKSYRVILDHFAANEMCKFLLVTATADRADGASMWRV